MENRRKYVTAVKTSYKVDGTQTVTAWNFINKFFEKKPLRRTKVSRTYN